MDLMINRPTMIPPEPGETDWELADDWTFEYGGSSYRLPKGFRTDGASIPRFLWRVCGTPLEVPRLYAALVHDFLYSGGDASVSRCEADMIFRDIQIALGRPRWKCYVEYWALRAFGGSHWWENQEGDEDDE